MRRRHVLTGMAGLATMPALSQAASAATGDTVDATAAAGGRGRRLRTGFEVLQARDYDVLRDQRVGIISNPTGVLPGLRHEVDLMHESGKVNIVAVFGPEHGFRGTSQAGEGEDFFNDPKTGLPVYNAYNNRDRMAQVFDELNLDTVIFDIQDVGARFYTFIWTMYLAMEAAATLGMRFVVLDRPNPIGGERAMGPVLHPEHATFVGLKSISQQHGMTVGELARLFNGEFVPESPAGRAVDLTVVPMWGWRRDMRFEDTGLPFVPPSPNMPTPDTAHVYPGTCLFEAVRASEGRGTTRPFEFIGAPGVDHRWEQSLRELDLPGVSFREAYFKPTFSKHRGETCGGVQVVVTDRERFDAIRTAIAMIVAGRRIFPEQFAWRESSPPPYWIDKLTGTDWVRTAIEADKDVDEIVDGWRSELRQFRRTRERYLIYRRGHGRWDD